MILSTVVPHVYNLNDRWNRLCLVSWAAAPCVWTSRAPTRNLLTYLLTYNTYETADIRRNPLHTTIKQYNTIHLTSIFVYESRSSIWL